jgi:D-serine dehydratase
MIERVRGGQPSFWANPVAMAAPPLDDPLGVAVDEARERLARASGLLRRLFPQLGNAADPLRSPLIEASDLAASLGAAGSRWWIKGDHELPIAGSVKARGGFHEVIAHAERLARAEGLLDGSGDLTVLASGPARQLFSRHSIVVGSTGNLGMSIGIISAALGFEAVVHMSSDAKVWKRRRLRDHGVTVHEHGGDYAQAVQEGRSAAARDRFAHFVDDERSVDLFTGYAAAGSELADQLRAQEVEVSEATPLFVHIPCGVGGAPGGITYGLKRIFGPNVHCIFAEPVQSPCMLVQLLSGIEEPVSVYDLGLSNRTEADGLAVGQASMLVAPLMRTRLDAVYTLCDQQLLALLHLGHEAQALTVEPSAAAAFAGPLFLSGTAAGRAYLESSGVAGARATHVMWTTGGSLIPKQERDDLLGRAARVPRFQVDQA